MARTADVLMRELLEAMSMPMFRILAPPQRTQEDEEVLASLQELAEGLLGQEAEVGEGSRNASDLFERFRVAAERLLAEAAASGKSMTPAAMAEAVVQELTGALPQLQTGSLRLAVALLGRVADRLEQRWRSPGSEAQQ